ncbi:putative 2-aminoethylphosphonate ABC transporter permease subunit [uncultured Clostridium sp.]|uniref:putative 2-aminoethylphosphonate ABC transporter permease subunit n=1 Tax=uncultured Clostridium sp. TaxID=59620 RepID=UPI0026224FF8|nr:putative 2-aminoethylphosphonate ABC transporter permease subunit [uncultured Clostridium sp.]
MLSSNKSLDNTTEEIKGKASMNMKKIILIILCLVLSIFLIVPLAYLGVQAFSDIDGNFIGLANFSEYLKSKTMRSSFFNTLFVALTSTSIATVLAFLYAYGLRRASVPMKWLFRAVAMLPIFAPTMLHGIGLVYLFGNKGIVTEILGINIGLYGATGIILAQIIYIFPQIFLILDIGLSTTDFRLYEVSKVLGVSKIKEFLFVTIPSIKYALISSFFIAFTLCFTDFGAAKIVGGNFNVLAIDVYKQIVGQQNMPMGATVGILLIIPALISFFVTQKVQKKQTSYISSKSLPYVIEKDFDRDITLTVIMSLIAGGILIVMLSVLLASLVKLWPYDLSLTLSNYSMADTLDGMKPFFNSIAVSILTALIGTVFVFIVAYLTENTKKANKIKAISHFLSILPMALPGLVLGISYVLFFNTESFRITDNIHLLNSFNVLYGSIFLMVFCNIVHFYSVTFITATTAIKKIDKEINMAAESLGVSEVSFIKNVALPLCMPAFLENFMYLFVNSMVTVSALIFLYTADLKVAAISIVQFDDKGDIARAAALSIMIVLTNIVVKILYELFKKYILKEKYSV